MTTKSLSLSSTLTTLYINLLLSSFSTSVQQRRKAIAKCYLLSIATICSLTALNSVFLVTISSVPAMAEDAVEILDTLPPPPPVSPRNRLVKHKYRAILPIDLDPPAYTSNNSQREYTFSAPKDNGEAKEESKADGYKVQVFGNTEELLDKVRDIEPSAFQSGEIIQVGTFSEQDNAENLVRELALAGFWARIVDK